MSSINEKYSRMTQNFRPWAAMPDQREIVEKMGLIRELSIKLSKKKKTDKVYKKMEMKVEELKCEVVWLMEKKPSQ